jgi:hypothetical protein
MVDGRWEMEDVLSKGSSGDEGDAGFKICHPPSTIYDREAVT